MNQDYRQFKRKIQGMCRPSVLQLCRRAGLNDREVQIITMFYVDRMSEFEIAERLNMSRSAYHENKKLTIGKMMDYQKYIESKL